MANERADRETDWPPSDRARKKPRLESEDDLHAAQNISPRYAVHSPDNSGPSQSIGKENSARDGPPDSRHPRDYDRKRDLPRDDFAPAEPPPPGSPSRPVSAPPSNAMPAPPSPGDGFRLLLANLSYNSTENQIVDFFHSAGADVERAHLVKVTRDNRFNGNAYLYLKNQRSVNIALEQNGIEFLGRKLRVSDAQTDQLTACVRGLSSRATSADVEALFRDCKIVDVRSRPVKGTLELNTWFVDFADEDSFNRALAKDRSQPGLMICIATAQSISRPGLPRTPRDSGPPPFRPDDPRDDRREDRRDDRRHDDRDRTRDRPPPDEFRDNYERRPGLDDSQDGRRDRSAPSGNGGLSTRHRSRSPSRPFDREADRDRDRIRDRRSYERSADRRFPDDRGSRHDRRSPREDRYRDYESDRRDDRERDRRDYRRDSGGGRHDGPWDRDHRRGDRDHGGWSSGRDSRDLRSGGRPASGSRYGSMREDYGRYGDRSVPERSFDKEVTAVLTNLPFCEDRHRVESHLFDTLESHAERLRVSAIYPVGRRCGACVVVFRDEDSLSRALALQSIIINQRKVNILPLEVPSLARVQKLHPGFIPDDIMNDMRRTYNVDTLFVRMKQVDQLLLGIEDTRYLVRLLDIDGRPLCHTRYATVSYIAHRSHGEASGGFRPRRDDYDGGRGGPGPSNTRDRDDGQGEGADRRGDGDDGPRDDVDDDSKRGEDSGSHGYQNEDSGWKVRLTCSDKDELSVQAVWDAIVKAGIQTEFAVEVEDKKNILVLGNKLGLDDMKTVSSFDKMIAKGVVDLPPVRSRVLSEGFHSELKKTSGGDAEQARDKHAEPNSEGQKAADWDGSQGCDNKTTSGLLVSPLTPSPAQYIPMVSEKKFTNADWEMPKTSERLERLRSKIISGGRKEEDEENYAALCNRLEDFCSPQDIVHSVASKPDPKPSIAWRGTVKKGLSVDCVGFLVKREHVNEDIANMVLKKTPEELNIEFRAQVEHASFSHLLTPHSVVMIVKSTASGSGGSCKDLRKAGIMAGIVQSLRSKQKVGIVRFNDPQTGRKCVSLCMPPSAMAIEMLRIPWRFREFAGHNALFVVSGPKDMEA